MFYTKNVPGWERALRIIMGVAGLAFAYFNWQISGLAVAAGLVGTILAMSGLMGFCPMCAMVGRKLNKRS